MTRARLSVLVTIVVATLLATASPALSAPPTNDFFEDAVEIQSLPFSESRDTMEATTDEDDADVNAFCGAFGAPATDATVWYTITPAEDTNLVVTTDGTDYSTGIAVVTGEPDAFEIVNCGPRMLTVPVEAGVTYYVVVFDDQEDGEANGGMLELQVDLAAVVCGAPGAEQPVTIVGSGLIKGTSGDDVILGSAGPDRILGFQGDDIICAEGGNDVVDAGGGDDLVVGDGDDLPPFAPSNGDNDDTLRGGAGNDTLVGLGGDDLLIGNGGDDTLIGMGGEDTIHGGAGNDTAFGGPQDDRVHGDGGEDTLFGNFGSDLLNGGPGNDFLDGDNGDLTLGGPPPFPPGGNDDLCLGGIGVDVFENCEQEV